MSSVASEHAVPYPFGRGGPGDAPDCTACFGGGGEPEPVSGSATGPGRHDGCSGARAPVSLPYRRSLPVCPQCRRRYGALGPAGAANQAQGADLPPPVELSPPPPNTLPV